MMRKHSKVWLAIIVVLVALFGIGQVRGYMATQYKPVANRPQIGTPTFFFHGYGSSAHAEQHMTDAAKRAGVTKTVIRATVGLDGHVRLRGTIPAGTKNPIIQVQYTNNRNPNFKQDWQWAANVITAVQNRYRFKQMNLVGHSMGNMDIAYYLAANANSSQRPRLNRVVDIAGHWNGFDGSIKVAANGKPEEEDRGFKPLLVLRQTYAKTARVLNIYGDKGGQTDGTVPNNSSKTLRYLINGRAKSYQEKKMTGPLAQHSKLHSNPQVDRALIKFLWNK